VVQRVLRGHKSVPQVCKEYELYDTSAYAWARQAKIVRVKARPGRRAAQSSRSCEPFARKPTNSNGR
jgi:transposase-like protein